MLMTMIFFCFLIGCVTGLRSLTAPAVVCWGAHLGWLHFAGTRLAFIGHMATLIIFTLLALVELTADKLPKTPARTAPPGLIARIVMGAFCGSALAVSAGGSVILAVVIGSSAPWPGLLAAIKFAMLWLRERICLTSLWRWWKTFSPSGAVF